MEKPERAAGWERWIERWLPTIMCIMVVMALGSIIAALLYRRAILHPTSDSSPTTDKWASLGQLGDYFGGVLNPAFALLAFVALILSLVVQRIELRYTRTELERSSNAMEAQAKLLAKQAFEGTFFNLLRLHLDRVEKDEQQFRLHKEALRAAAKSLFEHTTGSVMTDSHTLAEAEKQLEMRSKAAVLAFHRYFISLETMCLLVEDYSGEDLVSRSTYDTIIRGTLDDAQVVPLMFAAKLPSSRNMKRMLENHALLADAGVLRADLALRLHFDAFEPSAFGSRYL